VQKDCQNKTSTYFVLQNVVREETDISIKLIYNRYKNHADMNLCVMAIVDLNKLLFVDGDDI
jgi:hypothetical protein